MTDDDDYMWLVDPVAPTPGPCDRCRCDAAIFGYKLERRVLSLCLSCAQKFVSDIETGGGGVEGVLHAYKCMTQDIQLIRGRAAGNA